MTLTARRVGRFAARWTTELIVVFVGVYGAFAVAEWDESRERRQRAAQVKVALAEEIRGIQQNTRRVALQSPGMLDQIDSALAAGVPVPLEPMMEAIGFRMHVWEGTLASGGLGLLDVETFYSVSEFYNELNKGFVQLAQMRDLSETMLLPILDQPPSILYEPGDGPGSLRLKPQYRWYLDGTRRTAHIARCVTVMGDSLLLRLGATPDTTAPPLSPDDC